MTLAPKLFLLSTLILAAPAAQAVSSLMQQRQQQDQMMLPKNKKDSVDREELKWKITETMDALEPLAQRLVAAAKAEAEEVWASGKRDFRLKDGAINDVKNAARDLQASFDAEAKALELRAALEKSKPESPEAKRSRATLEELQQSAKDWHDRARSELKSLHKTGSEALLRDLRNWITVSDGELLRASNPDPSPKVSPTP